MPRQRMIKPEFFDSESLALCSVAARLCFIGLWVMGDDYGNQKAQLVRLQHRIFPYDEMPSEDFVDLLCELEDVGCIKGYEIDGERYITVPNFGSYQTVRKPSSSNVPKPPKAVENVKRTSVIHQWRTSGALVTHQCGSDALVTHYDATSAPKERKKERSNFSLREKIAKERNATVGAAMAEATPPAAEDSMVPCCPLCSKTLRFDPSTLRWQCEQCGDVEEPEYREAVA